MSKKSTRLEALQNMFRENEITSDSIEQNTVLINQIKKFAGAVPDYRNEAYVKHPLKSKIMIVFFAVLADADEWGEIESFARKKKSGCARIWIFLMGSQRTIHTG